MESLTSPPSPSFPPPHIFLKAENLSRIFLDLKLTVVTAESLTGGLVSASLTSVPGSSGYFLAGFNTYSNESKEQVLEVPAETLKKYGAVSPQCAESMAANAARIIGSDLGVSTTGIAGPDGGSPEKPVGLVYFSAFRQGHEFLTWKKIFSGSRHVVTLLSVETALDILEKLLTNGKKVTKK
jgi:PncC family amidohydrolase